MLSRLKLLPLFIVIIWLLTGIHPAAAQDDPPPLDIILLLDSSGSTFAQRGLIEKAAGFLLDYLEANAESAGRDYRLSIVGFNQEAIADSALSLGRPTEANLAKFFEDTPTGGDTDFRPALNFALDEFIRLKSLENGRVPIVILMTDGQPARGGDVLPDLELTTYFSELEETVTAISNTGVQIFVVGIGDAEGDQDRWQNLLRDEEQYAYIDDSSNLSEVYWRFLSKFMGGEQTETVSLVNVEAKIVLVEPYLDELTFTILKDVPEATVEIRDPSGNLYTQLPTRGGGETDLHEIYIIPTPDEGEWEVTLQGSDGRLLINRRYPKVTLHMDNQAVPVDSSFLVQAIIESDSLKNAEDFTLRLVDNAENYDEAVIDLLFESSDNEGIYEVTVPGFAQSGIYDLSPLVFVNDELIPSIQTEGVALKVVALPRIIGMSVSQESPDAPFMIKYEIENDEDIPNLNPKLQIVVDGEPVLVEDVTVYENGNRNTYSEFTPQKEGEYVIILKIEGTSSDGLNFADTFRVTVTFSLPTPVPVPSPTSASIPTATQEVVPEATEQSVQRSPLLPQERSNIWPFLTFLLLLILVSLVGLGVYFFYKKGGGIEERKKEPGFDNLPPTSSSKTDKTLNESLDEMGDSTSFADKGRLEELVSQRLRDAYQDVDGVSRDLINALPKLENMYGDTYYEQYVRPMLDQLRGVEVQVFLRALSFGLIKQWKEDKNAEHIVTTIYDKILGLTSNPRVTFVEVAHALESEAGAPILIEFLTNWVKFYRVSDEDSYKKISELDIGYVDSLKHAYSFLHLMNKARYSYGNRESYKQLESEVIPDDAHSRSQNLYLLFRDVKPIFTQPTPNDLEEWQEYKAAIEQVAKDLASQEKTYSRIPETTILNKQVDKWLASVNTRIETWAEQPEEIGPGKLELELRPTLDLGVTSDEQQRNHEWNYIVRGVLYHVGGTDVENLRLSYIANRSKPVLVNFNKHKDNIKLALNDHVKFSLVPVSVTPVNLSFEIEYKTLSTIGNTHQSRLQRDVFKSLPIAPDLNSYYIEEPLESPFVIRFSNGQPLTYEEFKRFAVRSAERKVAELVGYLNYSDGPEMIVLEGVRQSGKTTIINAVIETIDAIPINGLPKYFFIKINLREWWDRYVEGKNPAIADYRHQFWRHCYLLSKEKLAKLNEQTERKLMSDFVESKQLNGTNPFQTFREMMIGLRNETGMRPLLIVDDADLFHFFKTETGRLMNEITDLCDNTQGIIWTASDNRSWSWIETLRISFRANNNFNQKTIRTSFIDDQEVEKILTNRGVLVLTPLAKRAATVFTGGWVSLVQLLGDQLIRSINGEVPSDHEKAYRLVTVEDIRNVGLDLTEVRPQLFDYLQNSFTPYERLLMQFLVKEKLIDPDTAILQEIRYRSGWLGKEFLREKIQQAYEGGRISKTDCRYLEENWQGLFYQLKEKGMLENMIFQSRLSSLIRFKVGWLYTYYDIEPYISCETSQE